MLLPLLELSPRSPLEGLGDLGSSRARGSGVSWLLGTVNTSYAVMVVAGMHMVMAICQVFMCMQTAVLLGSA